MVDADERNQRRRCRFRRTRAAIPCCNRIAARLEFKQGIICQRTASAKPSDRTARPEALDHRDPALGFGVCGRARFRHRGGLQGLGRYRSALLRRVGLPRVETVGQPIEGDAALRGHSMLYSRMNLAKLDLVDRTYKTGFQSRPMRGASRGGGSLSLVRHKIHCSSSAPSAPLTPRRRNIRSLTFGSAN